MAYHFHGRTRHGGNGDGMLRQGLLIAATGDGYESYNPDNTTDGHNHILHTTGFD